MGQKKWSETGQGEDMAAKASAESGIKNLDETMAVLLAAPSTKNALSLARNARALEMEWAKAKKMNSSIFGQLYSDAVNLHNAILAFENDPQMVDQNAMARVLSGITPALLSLEEYLSGEDVDFWEILMDGSAVAFHVVASTPYITSAKYAVDTHFHEELVSVEDRLVAILHENGQDIQDSLTKSAELCDSFRKRDLSHTEKPAIIFLLRYIIMILSYNNFKESMKAK
jgi:hypothetical protein